jgi:hypothetical protein
VQRRGLPDTRAVDTRHACSAGHAMPCTSSDDGPSPRPALVTKQCVRPSNSVRRTLKCSIGGIMWPWDLLGVTTLWHTVVTSMRMHVFWHHSWAIAGAALGGGRGGPLTGDFSSYRLWMALACAPWHSNVHVSRLAHNASTRSDAFCSYRSGLGYVPCHARAALRSIVLLARHGWATAVPRLVFANPPHAAMCCIADSTTTHVHT